MASTSGVAYSDVLLNYQGDLIGIGGQIGKTPLLTMGGGLNGAGTVSSQTYVMGNFWSNDAGAAAAIAETTSVTAPTATHFLPTQKTNYVEIHHKKIQLTYMQQSNVGQISGQAIITAPHAIQRPQTQRDAHLLQMAIDIEWALNFGAGQAPTNNATIATTKGVITDILATNTTEVAASGAQLGTTQIDLLEAAILGASGMPMQPVLFGGAYQIQQLRALYGFAPASINIGGVTLNQVRLPIIGDCGVMFHPQYTGATYGAILALIDMARIRPVFLPVDGKPNVFIEPIGKTGASDQEQIYCQVGVDYDNVLYHGAISGLATAA